MKNIFHLPRLLAAAALALAAAGCGSKKAVYFKVEPSHLNHVSVFYAASSNEVMVMEFFGTGYCVMRRGDTPAAVNPFSLQPHAMRETRREFTPAEVNAIFQALVREGVCDKEPKDPRPPGMPFVSMYGSIQNNRFNRHSRTPGFLEMASWMKALFEHEQPGRNAPQPPRTE